MKNVLSLCHRGSDRVTPWGGEATASPVFISVSDLLSHTRRGPCARHLEVAILSERQALKGEREQRGWKALPSRDEYRTHASTTSECKYSIEDNRMASTQSNPRVIAALGAKDFLNDLGCKLVFYVRRVGRGVSMGSTCLRSVFQALTLSSRSSSDALCVGLMLCASGSMVSTLHGHKRQVRHLRETNVSCPSSPATRATHGVLVLAPHQRTPERRGRGLTVRCALWIPPSRLDNVTRPSAYLLAASPRIFPSLTDSGLLCGCRSRSTDVILRHLTVANFLYILCRGIPETMAALGMEDFLNNVGCKLVFYLQAVGKGMSFSTTCLLSVFQAITISPRSSRWAELKVKALNCIGPCTIICWVLHMLLNIRIPILVSDKKSNKNVTNIIDFQYCLIMSPDKDTNSIFAALSLSHDILCLKLMIWSSGSMVFILYRHKHQTQHIHRHNISPRSSAETRASQSILTLVCTFVSFYALSSVIYVWFSLYDRAAWWLVKTSTLTSACFPAASPFILMAREQCACRPLWRK
ncbi:PREDICTED: uncharacterized protein LOC102019555 [Chinchilla lanigera]|uniref:uncharacterized protein LOC102019555 n=1 Tax=Chinchilla lanigera TaxID=34839 RepID=UPI00069838B2|nr:PREDICTED: uncharacterized protein LOC102019555 [Chinchilla lanigera]